MRIVLLWLMVLLLAGVVQWSWADSRPAARVNGVDISVMRLERYFTDYLAAQGRALTSIRSPSLYKRLREEALDELIDKELLWQEAQRRGVEVTDAQVSAFVGEVERLFGTAEMFDQRLSDAGFDRASFADYTRHEMASQQVFALLSAVEPPSEAQVQAYFAANREHLQGTQDPENQSDSNLVIRKQGLELAKAALTGELQAQSRQTVRQRLRAAAQIQRMP
jgi:peptidyl-prolyl cis-trans isomerase C